MAYLDFRYILPMAVLIALQLLVNQSSPQLGAVLTLGWLIILVFWAKRLRLQMPQGTTTLTYVGHIALAWFVAGIIGSGILFLILMVL